MTPTDIFTHYFEQLVEACGLSASNLRAEIEYAISEIIHTARSEAASIAEGRERQLQSFEAAAPRTPATSAKGESTLSDIADSLHDTHVLVFSQQSNQALKVFKYQTLTLFDKLRDAFINSACLQSPFSWHLKIDSESRDMCIYTYTDVEAQRLITYLEE